jgi:FkbM family methyltransferase
MERIWPQYIAIDDDCGIYADRGFRLWFSANPKVYNRLNSLLGKIVGVDESFIDCGANYGWVSIPQASRIKRAKGIGKVLAIEADNKTANFLRKSFERNQLNNQIILEETFVGEKEGCVEFYSCTASGMSSAYMSDYIRDSTEKHGESFSLQKIECTTVEKLIRFHKIENIAAIKIDIEGAELNCLKGCRDIIESQPQIAFIVEINPITALAAGHSIIDIWNFLKENQCNIFTFGPNSSKCLVRCLDFNEKILVESEDLIAIKNPDFLFKKLGHNLNWK